jgi:glycosyltransferase involved in cell wall biosynthesis
VGEGSRGRGRGAGILHPAGGGLSHGQEGRDGLRHLDGPRDHRWRSDPDPPPGLLRGRGGLGLLPEDGGYADILVYVLDEEVHREAQARRGNVRELVDYLREAGVAHVLAHPMYGMPGPLDRGAVEKRLVLFGLWEFVNGSRPAQQNRLAREVALGVGPVELRQMAMRHGLPVPPHRGISGTGGSDDHGGIYGGTTYTMIPKVKSTRELREVVRAGEVSPVGEDGSVAKITHTGFRLAGAAIREGEEGRSVHVLQRFALRPALLRRFRNPPSGSETELLKHVPLLARLPEPGIRATLSDRYEAHLSGSLGNVGSGFPALDFLSSIGRFIDGHLFIAPYVGVHGYFGRERILRGEELARLYASCDVFVFPSTTDTLGRAVVEAQASGLPAVVCGIGGPRECIRPGVSGFVVDPGDENAFFSRIELLLDDAVAREKMGQAAREFAEGMTWGAVLDDLIELHSRLAGVRARRGIRHQVSGYR